jgi:hypothetical protein
LSKVGAVGCYDGKGIWEREEIALDEAASSEDFKGMGEGDNYE